MSKLTDDLRACDPIASPNVAGILMDAAAGRIEELEKMLFGKAEEFMETFSKHILTGDDRKHLYPESETTP